jgi:hypothetical protein
MAVLATYVGTLVFELSFRWHLPYFGKVIANHLTHSAQLVQTNPAPLYTTSGKPCVGGTTVRFNDFPHLILPILIGTVNTFFFFKCQQFGHKMAISTGSRAQTRNFF